MQTNQGVFIVIEGTDGSGKSTQFELLAKRLENAGYDIATLKFPRYDHPSSYFVKQYLQGAYGDVDQVGPYTASLFYALDRFAAAAEINSALAQGKIVLVDRYTGSNMAHQGTKFSHADQRRGYFIWLDNLEFELLRIPRPDTNLVLNVPAEVSQELLAKTEKQRDIHETDIEHLKRSVEVFNDLSQLFPKDFVRIDCVRSGELLTVEIISNLLWEKIFPMLPTKPVRKAAPIATKVPGIASTTQENPYVQRTRTGLNVTSEGREFLEGIVTDTTGSIYAFKEKLNATVIAAAIARASKRPEDLRTAILDTLTKSDDQGETTREAIALYADDSIKQLVGLHLVVEQTSNLVATKIEQGRLAAYVTPAVQFARYDLKDEHGQYKYVTPEHFTGQIVQDYRQSMDRIFEHYDEIVDRLTYYLRELANVPKTEQTAEWKRSMRTQACQIASAVLPVAAKTTVSIFASADSLEHIISHLLSDALPESKSTGQQLLEQARQLTPALLDDFNTYNQQGSPVAHRAITQSAVKLLADEFLPDNYAASFTEPVTLTDFWPRNELDLVADMLYEQSNLTLSELKRTIDTWPYERKTEVLGAYLGRRLSRKQLPGRALEKAHYNWDMMTDYAIFRDMLRHRIVDDLAWQQLTPRNGYEVPSLIEDAGLADLFEECFDISLQLHSKLQEAGFQNEAQYATLMGHRMRWIATYNAREAFHVHEPLSLLSSNPETNKLIKRMHDKLSEVHPVLADAMVIKQEANKSR
ncbi:MAG: FAD-dependent thymidylate synthase [Candidatus Saccharimonadales bacterium]|jgi:dTMP kinase